MAELKDETGKKYGRLFVLRRAKHNARTSATWECICECGRSLVKAGADLRSGNTRSCGCLRKDTIRRISYRHGNAPRTGTTREYRAWVAMHERCSSPKNIAWPRYGGSGITVDKRWGTFNSFLKDMGLCPKGHSLDRIDNTRGYSPSNCRWATAVEQGNNKNNNIRINYKGRTFTIAQLARETKLPYPSLYYRIKRGMTASLAVERALRWSRRGCSS